MTTVAELQTTLLLKDVRGEVVFEPIEPDRTELCPDCGGTGLIKGRTPDPTCIGTGLVVAAAEQARVARSVLLTDVVADERVSAR